MCFVHSAKSSAPLSVCLSFGTLSSCSVCFGDGNLLSDHDLDRLLPLPPSDGSGSPSGNLSGLSVGSLSLSYVS